MDDYKFQSPDGDFVYSDLVTALVTVLVMMCFNPLTGISSILTSRRRNNMQKIKDLFQSPDGDFVYSD